MTVALTAPFVVAFLVIPELIVRALFERGRFSLEDSPATAAVLRAYGAGLLAMVVINALRSGFQASGDTTTPMYVALGALAVNLLLKIVLYQPLGAVGIAVATSVNAWINVALLAFLALRRYLFQPDRTLGSILLACATASVVLANVALWLQDPFLALARAIGGVPGLLAGVVGLGLIGALAYGAALVAGARALGVTAAEMGLSRLIRRK